MFRSIRGRADSPRPVGVLRKPTEDTAQQKCRPSALLTPSRPVPSPLPSPPLGFGQRPKRRGAGPARRLSPGKSRRSGSQRTRAHCRVSGAEFELSHAQSSAARTLDGLEPYRRARKDAIQGVSPDAAMAGFLNATIRSSRPIQSASWSSRAGQRRQVSPTTRYESSFLATGGSSFTVKGRLTGGQN